MLNTVMPHFLTYGRTNNPSPARKVGFGDLYENHQKAFDAANNYIKGLKGKGIQPVVVMDYDDTIQTHDKRKGTSSFCPGAKDFIEGLNRGKIPFYIVTSRFKNSEQSEFGIEKNMRGLTKENFKGIKYGDEGPTGLHEGITYQDPGYADCKQFHFNEIKEEHGEQGLVFIGDNPMCDFPQNLVTDEDDEMIYETADYNNQPGWFVINPRSLRRQRG